MKNKYILLGIIVILAIFAAGAYNFDAITGYMNIDISNFDWGMGENPDEIYMTVLNESMEFHVIDDETIIITQKYEIGKNEECIKDCAFHCSGNEMEFLRAYVRKWGECLCRCVIT